MKLIVITGAKHSKKESVASKLAKNSDCIWIKPYTDRKVLVNGENWDDECIHLNKKQLSDKMDKESVLAKIEVNNHRYVFFENQCRAGFCILIGDDLLVSSLRKSYPNDVIAVRVHHKDEVPSERNLISDDEFDIVFNYGEDDFDSFESNISTDYWM